MTQQEVKCTPNNQCKCTVSNEEHGMLLCEVQIFSSNEYAIISIWKYDWYSPSKSNASTMLMQNANNA